MTPEQIRAFFGESEIPREQLPSRNVMAFEVLKALLAGRQGTYRISAGVLYAADAFKIADDFIAVVVEEAKK